MSLKFTTLVHQSLVNQCLHVAYVLCPMSICASRPWPCHRNIPYMKPEKNSRRDAWTLHRGAGATVPNAPGAAPTPNPSKNAGEKAIESEIMGDTLLSNEHLFKKNDLVRMTRNVTIMSHVYFLANVLDLFLPYNHIFRGKSWGNEMKWEDVLWVPCLQQLLFSLLCPLSLLCDALAAAGHLRSCSPTGLQQWSFRIGNVLKTMP